MPRAQPRWGAGEAVLEEGSRVPAGCVPGSVPRSDSEPSGRISWCEGTFPFRSVGLFHPESPAVRRLYRRELLGSSRLDALSADALLSFFHSVSPLLRKSVWFTTLPTFTCFKENTHSWLKRKMTLKNSCSRFASSQICRRESFKLKFVAFSFYLRLWVDSKKTCFVFLILLSLLPA